MTVIEMLNKIASDENYLPLKLKFYDDIFTWDVCEGDWLNEDGTGFLEYNIPYSLNNNVEVLFGLSDLKKGWSSE